ncbi:MAG: CSLREA domain-containing protein [Thermoanaerobaculia bacterium]
MERLKTLFGNGFKLGARSLLAAALAVTALGLAAPPAGAATIIVNTTTDQSLGDCSSSCSLRDAVATAADFDTVSIPAGTYVLTLGAIAVDGKNVTLAGAGARSTLLDGNAASRVLEVGVNNPNNSGVTISDLTVRNGQTNSIGGGGIRNEAGLTVLRCLITANLTQQVGGGIYNGPAAALLVLESLVAGNQSQLPGGQGGGIFSSGALLVLNSTVSGNTAALNGGGVLITSVNFGLLFQGFAESTIAGNSAPSGGGILTVGTVIAFDTIFGGNTGGNCAFASAPLLSSTSLDSDGSCGLTGPGDLSNVNPLLGPLANNGGPTDTYALLTGSPAIDAGVTACQPTDQRGVSRPQGPACDIGAFERVLTPQEQIAALTGQVKALVTAGALTPSNAKPLLNTLDNAAKHLDKGQVKQTCQELGDFIQKVNGDIQTGKLTAADGQALITAANAIRTNLGC